MSFVTNFWRRYMESDEEYDSKMRARVARSAIYGQRINDTLYKKENDSLDDNYTVSFRSGFTNPEFPIRNEDDVDRYSSNKNFHSYVYFRDPDSVTFPNPYKAAMYFEEKAIKKRDELLAKYNKNADEKK